MSNTGGSSLSSSSSSLLSFIQTELQSILDDLRKKCPDVKKFIEEEITWLKDLHSSSGNIPSILGEHEGLLLLLEKISECSLSAKLIPRVITLLHRLISHAAIPPTNSSLSTALTLLEKTAPFPDDIQLRTLQCVMPLLTHYHCHGPLMGRAFMLCFRMMQTSKSPTLINASVAIIRQLVIWLFEQCLDEMNNVPTTEEGDGETRISVKKWDGKEEEVLCMSPFTADAFAILQDVCLLYNEKKPITLTSLTHLNKNFALELLESVLLTTSTLFKCKSDFASLIDKLLIQSFLDGVNYKSADFPTSCRQWRLFCILVREFFLVLPHPVAQLVTSSLNILEIDSGGGNSKIWLKALILEALVDILADVALIDQLTFSPEMKNEHLLVNDIMVGVTNLILGMSASIQGNSPDLANSSSNLISYEASLLKTHPLLQQIDKSSAPQVNKYYLLVCALTCISRFLDAQLAHFKNNPEYKNCRILLDTLWAAILKALITLLSTAKLQSDWLVPLISTFKTLCCLEAVLGMVDEALFSSVSALTEVALPEYRLDNINTTTNSAGALWVSEVNIKCSVLLLELGCGLGEYLEKAWIYIFQVIHSIDQLCVLKSRRMSDPISTLAAALPQSNKQKAIPPGGSPMMQLDVDEVGKLTDLSRQVIEKSVDLSSPSFQHFIKSLSSLSDSVFAIETVALPNAAVSMLPIQKIKQIILLNLSRFTITSDENNEETWAILVQHLANVLSSNDSAIRGLGSEIVTLMYAQLAKYLDGPLFAEDLLLQRRLIEAIVLLREKSQCWLEVQKTFQDTINRLLQHVGPYFSNEVWPLILGMMQFTIQRESGSDLLIKATFLNVSHITTELLPTLALENTKILVDILNSFAANKSVELNTCLTSIGFLWDVADHVRKIPSLSLWVQIIQKMSLLGVDERPEVRHGAVQTIFRALEIGGGSLSKEDWETVLNGIVKPLMETIPRQAKTADQEDNVPSSTTTEIIPIHHSRASMEQQWNETQTILLQGITQVCIKFINILCQVPSFSNHFWNAILMQTIFSFFCSDYIELNMLSTSILQRLVQALKDTDCVEKMVLAVSVRECWINMGDKTKSDAALFDEPSSTCCNQYSQESLFKLIRTFVPLFSLYNRTSDLGWLEKSLTVFTYVLNCPTPSDPVRDVDSMTELQRAVIDILDTCFDYEKEHLKVRSLYFLLISSWLEWIKPRNSNEKILNIPQPIRRRQRTVVQSEAGSAAMPPKGRVTFAAFSLAILARLHRKIELWSSDQAIYDENVLFTIIPRIARISNLQFELPAHYTTKEGGILWKEAKTCLNKIIIAVTHTSLKHSPEKTINLWKLIVPLVNEFTLACQMSVPDDISLDQLDADEEFDIEQVNFIIQEILPSLSQELSQNNVNNEDSVIDEYLVPDQQASVPSASQKQSIRFEEEYRQLIEMTVKTLSMASRLYIGHHDVSKLNSRPQIHEVFPVIKEKLAVHCLQLLFQLSSSSISASEDPTQSPLAHYLRREMSTLSVQLPAEIHLIFVNSLFERCRLTFARYLEDYPLMGTMPFPRLREDELLYLLDSLTTLTLSAPLNSENPLLSSKGKAHLLVLYPYWLQLLMVERSEVAWRVQRIFKVIGEELHFL